MRIRIDASSRMPLEEDAEVAVATLRKTLTQRPSDYVELCMRSTFSFLRGASSPESLMRRAHAHGYDAVALTDFNGLYGMVRAWEETKKIASESSERPMRLIVGAELALAEGGSIVLHVESAKGYANLCTLLTKAHAHAREAPPLIATADVMAHTEGLWGLSMHAAEHTLGPLHEAFKNRFSLGVYIHRDGNDRARIAQVEASANRVGAAICATGRVLFGASEDKALLDVLQCIREGKTLESAGTSLLPNAEARLKSPEEVLKQFGNHPEWLRRTRMIADACHFSLSELKYKFPSDGPEPSNAKLRRLTYEGAAVRYPHGIQESVRVQIEKELALIAKIDVAAYFLSVHDIVQMARARDILCQGRGSAANSAVCFCLGVTAVDPARSNLLFERFLSEERNEPPDIDVDFEHERREEVIQDIYAKYGRERAAMVSEVICYRGKSALREVGKVFGFSPEQVDRLSSLVSYWDSVGSVHAQKLAQFGFDAGDGRIQQVLSIAKRMQGVPRHLSIHVGGFVVSSEPLCAVAPIEPAAMEGRTVIPWDKDDIDALGFFKMDVLGLGMLTAIRKALNIVANAGDPVISKSANAIDQLAAIPSEDPRVYDALCKADTVGVFQIESRAQMAMLPRLKPRRFYDLVIEVAIVRPGPIQGGMVHPYLRRRNGEEAIDAPHPVLEPILARTLGVPLFQEQVMQIAIVGAGYSGGEADQLRRDMAAWRKNGNLGRHRDKLKRGFRARGISDDFGERLYTQIQGFGEYGFPESHAASFALLVYASSWLKVHHPAAFATALINSQPMGFYSPSTILQDAARHGVVQHAIDVNQSDWDLMVQNNEIRLGLRLVKGLGEVTGRRIAACRPFQNIEDLRTRAMLNDAEMHALAESGALLPLTGENRRDAVWAVTAPREQGLFAGKVLDGERLQFEPMSRSEQLSLDYARTGTSVSDHPMKILRSTLKTSRAVDLLKMKKGARVEVAGLVICRQRPGTASGVVFITLEDETGFINLVLWAKKFEELRRVATQESLVRVKGRLDRTEGEDAMGTIHVIVETMKPLRMQRKMESMSRDFH